MAVDTPAPRGRMRRLALWGSLGLVLTLCAWVAAHGDQDATADIARPVTRTASSAASAVRAGSVAGDTARERQVVAAIVQALRSSEPRGSFPALTDSGRRAWASPARPPAVASAAQATASAPVSTVFPYQWVGLWTEPTGAADGSAPPPGRTMSQPLAIIAGPHSTWTVKQGDLLDEDWKIASISATEIQVIYLPSMARETISMSKQ
jgi:hypothetical protein